MITSAGKGMMGKSAIFESGIEKGSLFDGFDLTNKQTPETSYIILREACPVFLFEKGRFFRFCRTRQEKGSSDPSSYLNCSKISILRNSKIWKKEGRNLLEL